ncbi:aspartyl protease-like protein [Aphelenchoides avenae]|nr:aspartyl protease-like protein [Aphelenchus avenae]
MNLRTDTPWITVPAWVLDTFAKTVKAEYDFHRDLYLVNCDTREELPPVTFEIGRDTVDDERIYNYDIPATDYARPDPLNAKKCVLMVKVATDSPDGWELGTAFLRSHCLNIDYYDGSASASAALRK